MIIGVPKEIKTREYRVGMTPAGVRSLVSRGHKVLVEKTAGEGAGIKDADYVAAGAQMIFVPPSGILHGPAGVVMPYPGHEYHMHVRFPPPRG